MDGASGKTRKTAIIVAGGKGKRLGADIPKQFLPLGGKPLLFHAMEAFRAYDGDLQLVVVLPPDHLDRWRELCRSHGLDIPHMTVPGGVERYHSVKEGLAQVDHDGLVAVHDGARPLVDPDLIARCFEGALRHGAAIPVVPVCSSVREVSEGRSRAIDRERLRIVQTPQCFQAPLLRKAFGQPYEPAFTDEATMVERLGAEVFLVAGDERNIKVTNPLDLRVAEELMAASPPGD